SGRRPLDPPAAAFEQATLLDRNRVSCHERTAAARHSRSNADQEQGSCAADQRREGIVACGRPALERSPRAPDVACARSARGLAPLWGLTKRRIEHTCLSVSPIVATGRELGGQGSRAAPR